LPPGVQPVPCAAGPAAPYGSRMACGRRAHAGKHAMDEPRSRHEAGARGAAAACGRDKRLPGKARASMTPRKIALRTRLLYLAAAAFLPLAVMSAVGLLALAHQQRQQAERAGIEITRALSTAVDAELQRSISVLQGLSASPSLERGEMARFHELMRRVLESNPSWLTVILADPAGRQLANARIAFGEPLPSIVERAASRLRYARCFPSPAA